VGDIGGLGVAAAEAVARAIRQAVRAATGVAGLPGLADTRRSS
jgi:L-aminopeptidase/D-esterase-like protein